MLLTCQCPTPGICPITGRRVRWAEIQSCQSGSAVVASAPSLSCRDCTHRGAPALSPEGKQIGSTGCGCGNELSGILWWNCSRSGDPVPESTAKRCGDFSRS